MSYSCRKLLCAAMAAALLLISGCTAKHSDSSQSSQSSSSTSQQGSGSQSQEDVSQPDLGPVEQQPELPPVPAPEANAPKADPAVYDFSQPAPERDPVENDFFKNSAFVGDSRTDGFLIYSGINNGKNLTSNGLSIFTLSEKKALTINGQKYTLLEALGLEQYDQVYLSLGVNELGYYDDDGFYQSYCDAIDAIRAAQPNAVIYIQNLIPLNEQKVGEVLKRSYLNNEHLRIYNDLMKKAAQEKKAVYLDLYSYFIDENNALPYDASKDGVHLNGEYCKKWLTYLKSHTVDKDVYFAALNA